MSSTAQIEVESLKKVYETASAGNVHALGPIDLRIDAGEFVSIVGPSGCGKSTLLRIICGLTGISGGKLSLNGIPINGPNRNIGVVFQAATLLPWRTVLDNVLLPIEIRKELTKEKRDKGLELLKMVGLQDFVHRYPSELSGGMQQRVAIARALITDPSILLMDEPFGALDEFTRETMNDELLRIWDETKKTVIFITHSIPESVYMSDRVVVMSERPGRILADINIKLPQPRDTLMRQSPILFEHIKEIRSSLFV
ncbi:MAG: ABC transporter ATP-binding protein [Burkholderiaceae bacterium]|nr:ABC transporter ATP-binding protein [Burkholderiaceae bacterium]